MKNKIRHLKRDLTYCVSTAMLLAGLGATNQQAMAQDRYWPLDGNKRLTTYSASVSTYGGISVPTDFYPTVYSTNAEVLFSMYHGLTFPYDNVPNRVTLDAYGAVQAFPIPGDCKKYGVLDVYYVPTPHGHAVTYRTVDASAVINDINNTPLPTVTTPTGIFGGASGAPGQYGAVAARLNDDGTRYIYHLNFGTTLSRYTVSYTGTIGSATTITSSLPNVTGRMNISPDGNSLAFVNTSNQLVTYNLTSNTSYTYTGVTFSAGNSKSMQQVSYNGERRWYVSTGTAFGYVVEGSPTFYTISTVVGTKSSLALGQNGMIYYAQGTPGSTPGQIYYIDPSPGMFSTLVSGATTSVVQNGAYYFGNHVEGEDISSFPVAPVTIAFNINGQYVAPPNQVTVYNCSPIVLRRVSDYYKYRLRIKPTNPLLSEMYSSGIKEGKLPDSLDMRNLCSFGGGGWAACNFLNTAVGSYEVMVDYFDICGSAPAKTTKIIINVLPTISSMPITVNGQGGDTADVLLCDGSTALTLTATPDQVMKAYQIKLEKGDLSGGVFTGDGTSDSTSLTPAAGINNINLFSIGSGYLTGHSGYVRAIVSVTDTCSNIFKDTLVFRLSQLRTPDSVAYTVNGYGYDAIPPAIPLCEDTLNLMAQAAGNYDSFIVVLERGTLDPNTDAFIPDPNIDPKADTLEANAIPVNLVQRFPTYLKPGGVMYYDALRVSVMAKGPCGVSTAVVHTYMLEKSTPASNLSYTLNGISNGTDPVDVLLCGEEDALTINPDADGTITGYHILLEKGTWDAGVFTDSGSLDSASIAVDNFPLDLAAHFDGYLYPDDTVYRGDLRVTVTTQGPCLPPAQRAQVYRINHGEPITDLVFTVNDTFQLAELSPAPEVWMCNDTSLTLRMSQLGTIGDDVTVKVEKGTFNTTTGFEGLIGGSGLTRTIPYDDSIELYDISGFKSYLGGNPGIIQVTVTLEGPCTPAPVSVAQVFDVRSAIALVDFRMIGAVGNPRQLRKTTLDFDYLAQPITSPFPPDVHGWLGANSVGVIVDSAVSTTTIDSHFVKVSTINTPDTSHTLPLIIDYKNQGEINPSANYSFNFFSLIAGLGYRYFEVAYDTIKNNYTFRVTVSIKTQKCGVIQSYSFFKIMDGTFGINWKPAGISMEDRVPQLIIYPNPTENLVNFVWEGPKEGHISIQDITGKTIIKKDVVRTNGSTLSFDISNFPSGIYLYKAELDGEISSGKLEKH